MHHARHVPRPERHVREALSTLDPRDADVGTEVEIGEQRSLRDGHLERSSARDRRDPVPSRVRDLPTHGVLARHHPAGHGDLQDRHEMGALIEVTLQRDGVVAGIEGAGQGRQVADADQPQILVSVETTNLVHVRVHALPFQERIAAPRLGWWGEGPRDRMSTTVESCRTTGPAPRANVAASSMVRLSIPYRSRNSSK